MTPVMVRLQQGQGDPHGHSQEDREESSGQKAAKPAKRIVQTLNINAPGKTYPRDAAKYEAARKAFLKVLPAKGPGVTQSEMMALMKRAAGQRVGHDAGLVDQDRPAGRRSARRSHPRRRQAPALEAREVGKRWKRVE